MTQINPEPRRERPAIWFSSLIENPLVEKIFSPSREKTAQVSGLYGDSLCFLLAVISEIPGKQILHVCKTREQCVRTAKTISSIKGIDVPVLLSRGMEKTRSLFEKKEISEPERIHSLACWEKTGVLCADGASLSEITAPPRALDAETFVLEQGMRIDRDELVERLTEIGYKQTDFTEKRGEISIRGSIVDIFSSGSQFPLRIEFFGDDINSLREFSSSTQKSFGKTRKAQISPASFAIYRNRNKDELVKQILNEANARGLMSSEVEPIAQAFKHGEYFREIEWFTPFFWDERCSVLDFAKHDLIVSLPHEFSENALLATLKEKLEARRKSLANIEKSLPTFSELYLLEKEITQKLCRSKTVCLGEITTGENSIKFATEPLLLEQPSVDAFASKAHDLIKDGYKAVVFFHSKSEKKKFLDIANDRLPKQVKCRVGDLSQSVVLHDFEIALFSENILFEKTKPKSSEFHSDDIPSVFLTSFSQLKSGDYIVHREFGIGVFVGMKRLSFGTRSGDFLECAYKDGDKIFVPVEKLAMVQRYTGNKDEPKVEKLGSSSWRKTVSRVKKAVEEVAEDLVDLCAERKVGGGFQFSPRNQMFNEFEMEFAWSETPDQSLAIEDVMADMESEKAMDRLICGDVGFGKTEVALRAAFKACLDGKQVMIIVPTTLLASQHYNTALQRFKNYPVRVEMLSRFTSAKKERKILASLSDGSTDVVIGTHKILGKKVNLKNPGLVVIDEEQKFGVTHKKSIRAMKTGIDVLTLSATPIPRTLQLSLADVRDISVINTPPEGRQPVEVYVQQFNSDAIKNAVEKEVSRGCNVFFVHNRIKDIFEKADFLQQLLPQAKIAVTHGRLNETILSKTIERFSAGEIDVLVTTAIVESGLDIPRANTIIVNDAHRMGLADLYQLKGRVGRSDKKAYAYFLVPSVQILSEESRKKLEVLSRLTDLGSGFKLATADLQIRGAGTLFGERQSGHIADVGLEFYLELLRDAIENRQNRGDRICKIMPEIKTQDDAYIPESYIESGAERLFYYKKISSTKKRNEIEKIRYETEDRFGTMPEPMKRLLLITELKIELVEKLIHRVDIGEKTAVMNLGSVEGESKKISIPLPRKDRYQYLISVVEKLENPASEIIETNKPKSQLHTLL